MIRPIPLLASIALCLSLSGCFVHDHGHRRGRRSVERSRACHPSQYWDGERCRHKGKGHGARKHDGRR